MNVSIKKVGHRDGQDRFILVNSTTRDVLTVHDVSERSLRKYFGDKGVDDAELDECFARARQRYDVGSPGRAVDDVSDTAPDDDLLFELGLGEDEDVH